jgi:hypothetical protein
MTTAASNALSKASISSRVARLTSDRKKQGPPLRTALLPNHRSDLGDMPASIPPKLLAVNHFAAAITEADALHVRP